MSRPCSLNDNLGVRAHDEHSGRLCAQVGLASGRDGLEGIRVLKYFLVALGGALGSMARFWIGSTVANRMGTKFPFGTFVINIAACVFIGFTLTFMARRTGLNPAWRFLVPVGLIGAFSTFSTYEWETLSTIRNGAFLMAALYAAGSLIFGLAAVWGGAVLAEIFF
jgi:fluoride exporter